MDVDDMECGGAEATAAREGGAEAEEDDIIEVCGAAAAPTAPAMGAPQTSHSVAVGSFLNVQAAHVLAGRPGGGGGFLVDVDVLPASPEPPRRRSFEDNSSLVDSPRKALDASYAEELRDDDDEVGE